MAAECAEDLAADGVVYAEVRYAPELFSERGLHLDAIVEAVQEGFRARRAARARARAGGSGSARCCARCGRTPARWRSPSWPCGYRDTGVVGFDIAGPEAGFPPTRNLDAFEYLRQQNAHFTIHAGEAFGLPSIWEAIQHCGAERLGHGVRIVDDIKVDGDGTIQLGTVGELRAGPPHPAGDVPVVQRADRRRAVDRRAPDRAAHASCASGSRSTPTTG